MDCKCGCGQRVKAGRVFVNQGHQLDWMQAGGAREIGALQPTEAKAKAGRTSGRLAAESGALAERGQLGARRAHELAEEWRSGAHAQTNWSTRP